MSQITNLSVTIASGAALSGAAKLNGATLLGIEMPAVWTTANLTFQHSIDGVTYADLYNALGSEVVVTVTTSRYYFLQPADWSGIVYLKLRSGTGGTPVNQGADRILKLVCREL